MSQENGGIDPLIHNLGEKWLPIELMSYWTEFKKRWPAAANMLRDNAHRALFGRPE